MEIADNTAEIIISKHSGDKGDIFGDGGDAFITRPSKLNMDLEDDFFQ